MPARDHSGPEGTGPMTGRKLGDCSDGAKEPLAARFSRRGWGRGFRRGRGGRGRGFGQGRGWRFWNSSDVDKKDE
jgi:hypothetical protein